MRSLADLNRVYHPVCTWEEMRFNMWGAVDYRPQYLSRAIEFTGDHNLYGGFMIRVVDEWPISCENALTDSNINRKAWVGHAACALAFRCPQDIVREAWGKLSDEQRALANRQASTAIGVWEANYRESKGLRSDVGEPLLL